MFCTCHETTGLVGFNGFGIFNTSLRLHSVRDLPVHVHVMRLIKDASMKCLRSTRALPRTDANYAIIDKSQHKGDNLIKYRMFDGLKSGRKVILFTKSRLIPYLLSHNPRTSFRYCTCTDILFNVPENML